MGQGVRREMLKLGTGIGDWAWLLQGVKVGNILGWRPGLRPSHRSGSRAGRHWRGLLRRPT